jgi:hypothetical protein
MKIKNILVAAVVTASTLAGQAYAGDWYAGLDATNLSYNVKFSNSNETYDLNPLRFKAGYISDSGFGAELQLLGSGEDSTLDGGGSPFQTESKTSWGFSGIWSSTNEKHGLYGSLGILSLATTYTDQTTTTDSDTDDVLLTSLGLGYYVHVSENLKLTIDYTTMSGDAAYNTFSATDVDVKMSGFGLGVSYVF